MNMVDFYYIERKKPLNDGDRLKVAVLTGKKLEEYKKKYGCREVANKKEYRVPAITIIKDEVFVHSLGYIKAKTIENIPSYDGLRSSWNEYIAKYGYDCLFYSLTGYELHTNDCCAYKMQCEFKSIILSNIDLGEYTELVHLFKTINSYQQSKLSDLSFLYKGEDKNFLFEPSYGLVGLMTTSPFYDTLKHDDKLVKLYVRIRSHELTVKGDNLAISRKTAEKEVDDGVFPVSMSERIRYLFGDECEKTYREVVNKLYDVYVNLSSKQ